MAKSEANVQLSSSDTVSDKQKDIIKLKKKKFIRIPGIKFFLFIFAVSLIFFEGIIPYYKDIDQKIFRFSSNLTSPPVIKKKVAIINLTPIEMHTLIKSPENFSEFQSLLRGIIKIKSSSVAVIIDEMLNVHNYEEFETLTTKLNELRKKSKPAVKKEINALVGIVKKNNSKNFIKLLERSKVILALRQKGNGKNYTGVMDYKFDYNLKTNINENETYLARLPETSFPTLIPDLNSSGIINDNAISISPVATEQLSGSWPLVWKDGKKIVPDICTLMYSRMLNDKPEWIKESGVMFGFSFQGTDSAGFVLPRNSSKQLEKIERFSLNKIAGSKNFDFLKNKAVFIGQEDDPILEAAASAFVCITSGAVSNTPYQAIWVEKAMIVIFFLYIVFAVPRLKPGTSILISSITVFTILIVLIGINVIKNQWLLITLPILYLSISHFLMLVWLRHRKNYNNVQQKSEAAFYKLGQFQYEQNRYDQAYESLLECTPDNKVLELLYKLGVSLERKRQYDKASMVFEYINDKNKKYKDAGERAERLTNIIFGRTSVGSSDPNGTLVISADGMNRPVLGRYEIEKELGRGAMGIVYLGQDPKIGRKIAIKTMDFTQTFEGRFEEVKDRFFREAKAAGRLTHPNIVTIYDAGEEQDLAYIAMDFVPGVTLSDYTKVKNLLPVKDVYEIIQQTAEALDYAHKQSIIHRDIKPGNIIFNKETRHTKVTDFGIARIADTSTTRPGIILGSPSFMAPEQLKGKEIDGRTDIFSLGVTMFQLLTGKLPFTGTDLSSLGYQITSVKHNSILSIRSELPKSAEKIINRALQKSPSKRYQTAGGMAKVLKEDLKEFKT